MPGVETKVNAEAEGGLWRVQGPAAAGEPVYHVGARLADAVALVGYDRSPRSPRPGEDLGVSLYWEALHPLQAEYHSFVHLLDAEGRMVAQSDRQPGGVFHPTIQWQPGERLRDDHLLAIPPDTPTGAYRLLAGMYTLAQDGTLQPLGEPVSIGQVGVKAGLEAGSGDPSQPASAQFAGQIELLGTDPSAQGDALTVVLYWRGLQPPDTDYAVFLHLLATDGEIVAQHDSQPQDGAYPTSIWDAGELVVDEHTLSLPPGLPADDYRLRVGLYLPESGERLPVNGGGDSVELGPVALGE
jgi:hypothetical protein